MNAENDSDRKNALARHILSVRKHVDELDMKNYSSYLHLADRETIDFVIMFIPNEGPFRLAMTEAPSLWDEAFRKKVMIISPTNLVALLRLIHIAWTREEQSRNQREIFAFAAEENGECRFVNDVLHKSELRQDLFWRAPIEWAHGKMIIRPLTNRQLVLKVLE